MQAQANQLYEAYVQSLQAAGQSISTDDLTEEQKEGILRNQAIQEMMNSSEVQTQIENAVNSAGSTVAAGISSLKGQLDDGARELVDGTGKFTDEISGLDSKVEEEIDSLLSSVMGEEVETVSFVSEKNTGIKSVQFVIKTDAIQVAEAEEAMKEVQEPLSFWEKLVQLFKG